MADPEDVVMPFGKHSGRTLGWIAENDLLYLDWLVDVEIRQPGVAAAVRQVHRRHEREIEDRLGDDD